MRTMRAEAAFGEQRPVGLVSASERSWPKADIDDVRSGSAWREGSVPTETLDSAGG